MLLHNIYIRINPKKIAFLKFIIEGYDGLATVTTVDRNHGLVRLAAPSERVTELWPLLGNLAPVCRHDHADENSQPAAESSSFQ